MQRPVLTQERQCSLEVPTPPSRAKASSERKGSLPLLRAAASRSQFSRPCLPWRGSRAATDGVTAQIPALSACAAALQHPKRQMPEGRAGSLFAPEVKRRERRENPTASAAVSQEECQPACPCCVALQKVSLRFTFLSPGMLA